MNLTPPVGLTLLEYSKAKYLPPGFLQGAFRIHEERRQGVPNLVIPYFGPNGDEMAKRYRWTLRKGAGRDDRFSWKRGTKPQLYGLDGLDHARKSGYVWLCEGESDVQTLRFHGEPAFGLPGATAWNERRDAGHFAGVATIFVVIEPDDGGEAVKEWLAESSIRDRAYLVSFGEHKDPSGLHLACAGETPDAKKAEFASHPDELRKRATAWRDLAEKQRRAVIDKLRVEAQTVLAAPDPPKLVARELRRLHLGGDLKPALIAYVSATTRVLAFEQGDMLSHLLLTGTSSAGKSYPLDLVQRLLPREAFHVIEASSPRVFIYENAPMQHRVLRFGEADSLPRGEENAAASAVRNLLQDGYVHYKVVVRDAQTGRGRVQEIVKPGPTVLFTTSTHRLPPQLDTRVFTVEVPDSTEQIRMALEAQAERKLTGNATPDAALIAFQALLQAQAPWRVVVPFAPALAKTLGQRPIGPRVLRDFNRIVSMIAAVAVLRHTQRTCDADGRLVAEAADYEFVRKLITDVYRASTSGASATIRATVVAVEELCQSSFSKSTTVTRLATKLGITKQAASGRVKSAIKHGYLVNLADVRRGVEYALQPGESLPEEGALPSAADLGLSSVKANAQQEQGDAPATPREMPTPTQCVHVHVVDTPPADDDAAGGDVDELDTPNALDTDPVPHEVDPTDRADLTERLVTALDRGIALDLGGDQQLGNREAIEAFTAGADATALAFADETLAWWLARDAALSTFLNERCERDEAAVTAHTELYSAYLTFLADHDAVGFERREFVGRLSARGPLPTKLDGVNSWLGVRLRSRTSEPGPRDAESTSPTRYGERAGTSAGDAADILVPMTGADIANGLESIPPDFDDKESDNDFLK